MRLPSPFLFATLSASLYLAASACARLTPGDAAAIEAADAAACAALSLIPIIGGPAALACVGEEATLKAALDRAVAAGMVDAGAGAPVGAEATVPRVAVHRKHGGRRVRVGYVPAELASGCQAALDGADAGAGR